MYFMLFHFIVFHFIFHNFLQQYSPTHVLIIYLFIQVYCPYATLGYERPQRTFLFQGEFLLCYYECLTLTFLYIFITISFAFLCFLLNVTFCVFWTFWDILLFLGYTTRNNEFNATSQS
jgi:hypothetical protein